MKKLKVVILSLLIMVMAMAGAGCSGDNTAEKETKDIKVVSLLPGDTEILYGLGLDKEIVGVSTYCNYPKKADEHKNKLGTGTELNIEDVIALDPDMVFIGKMASEQDKIKQLEEAQIQVVQTGAETIDETYDVIETIGKKVSKEKEAQDMINKMKEGFNSLEKKVEKEEKGENPSIYVEVSPLEMGLFASGKNTFHDEIITLIGGKNIFSDLDGWNAVSEESVIERDPQVILTTTNEDYGVSDPVGSILKRTGWERIKAVKTKSVYEIDGDMSTRAGPRLVEAAENMYELVYQK